MKKIFRVAMITVFLTLLTSCSFLFGKEKEFNVDDMTITLTEAFVEKDVVGYTNTYQSTDVMVFALKEEKELVGRNLTLDEYIELVLEVNKFDDVEYEEEDSYVWYEYTKEVSGKEYYYYARAYETEDAFWLIQFACFESKQDKLFDDITKYADSIVFEE